MDKLDYLIRLMCVEDITPVAKIHCESFANYRSSLLGPPFVRKMYRWFVEYQPCLAFVAVVDDQPVGFVTGAIGGYTNKIFRYAILEIVRGLLRNPRLLLRREIFNQWRGFLRGLLLRYRKMPSTASSNLGYTRAGLASIAVGADFRGNNIADSLVSAFESAAQQQGATILGLSVRSNNLAARRLYERCGWNLVGENETVNSAYYTKEIKRGIKLDYAQLV